MKHAGSRIPDDLESLLTEIRTTPGLVEKSRGFFGKSRAFLHFHEDPTGVHADIRRGTEFERYRVESPEQRLALLGLIRSVAD